MVRQMSLGSYESLCASVSEMALPLALVDLEAFDANVNEVRKRAQGTRVRVASKSLRCSALLRRVLDAGAPFSGIMAYSVQEACDLLDEGFDDILVAYPTHDAVGLKRAAEATAQGKNLVLMADSEAHLRALARAGAPAGACMQVCLDVDMSTQFGPLHFGVDRSPLRTTAAVRTLAERAKAIGHLNVVGVMGYEAQIAGVADHAPGKAAESLLVRRLKQLSLGRIAKRRAEAVAAVEELWGPLRIVNAGGSGSLSSSRLERVVTELTAGSAFYAPQLFDHYDTLSLRPAMLFALEVCRAPREGVYTCLGGGYIASGPPGQDRVPAVVAPATGSLLPHQGAGEVQTPVRFEVDPMLPAGAPIFFRHAKAGELCERFANLILVKNGTAVSSVPTYRGQGKTYV